MSEERDGRLLAEHRTGDDTRRNTSTSTTSRSSETPSINPKISPDARRPQGAAVERSETAARAALENTANNCGDFSEKSSQDGASFFALQPGSSDDAAHAAVENFAVQGGTVAVSVDGNVPDVSDLLRKPGSPTLQNVGAVGKGPQRADAARTARWLAREVCWRISALPRVQTCGRWAFGDSVGVHKTGDRVGYSGLVSCQSVWACPVCSARLMAERRLEMMVILAGASRLGATAFATYTLRHSRTDKLDELMGAISYGVERIRQDHTVKKIRKELGFYGYIRVTEITHGVHGFHPHVHMLYLFANEVTEEQRKKLADAELRAWLAAAKCKGLKTPLAECQMVKMLTNRKVEEGQEISLPDDLSKYMTKSLYDEVTIEDAQQLMTKEVQKDFQVVTVGEKERAKVGDVKPTKIALEMTGSLTKKGKKKNRTPWEILESIRRTGDKGDIRLWRAYELGTKGKRSIVFSQGLQNMFKIEELTDEEIMAEDLEGDRLFDIIDWTPIARDASLGARLLQVVRRGGFSAGWQFCQDYGIPTAITPACVDADADLDETLF